MSRLVVWASTRSNAGLSWHPANAAQTCAEASAERGTGATCHVICVHPLLVTVGAQVDVGSVDAAKFDDAYFKPTEKKDKKKGEAEFFQVGTALKI